MTTSTSTSISILFRTILTIISIIVSIITIYYTFIYKYEDHVLIAIILSNCVNISVVPYGLLYLLKYYLWKDNYCYLILYGLYIIGNICISTYLILHLCVIQNIYWGLILLHFIILTLYYLPFLILLLMLPILYYLGTPYEKLKEDNMEDYNLLQPYSPSIYSFDSNIITMNHAIGRLKSSKRSITQDVLDLKNLNIPLIVNLLSIEEIEIMNLDNLDEFCNINNIRYISFPIRDKWLPNHFLFSQLISELIYSSDFIHCHVFCYGGKGRTGLLTAILSAIKKGGEINHLIEAIYEMRKVRSGTLYNPLQLIYAFMFIFWREWEKNKYNITNLYKLIQ